MSTLRDFGETRPLQLSAKRRPGQQCLERNFGKANRNFGSSQDATSGIIFDRSK